MDDVIRSIYVHTDIYGPEGNLQKRHLLNGVLKYAIFLYVRFGATRNMCVCVPEYFLVHGHKINAHADQPPGQLKFTTEGNRAGCTYSNIFHTDPYS